MKIRLLRFFLITVLASFIMTGCQAAKKDGSVDRAPEQVTQMSAATASGKHTNPALTLEEAQKIALKHAGYTADQVTALHTEYEIENGIPQYDVEFHYGSWEYDYEIHADTGEVLSFSKDD